MAISLYNCTYLLNPVTASGLESNVLHSFSFVFSIASLNLPSIEETISFKRFVTSGSGKYYGAAGLCCYKDLQKEVGMGAVTQ